MLLRGLLALLADLVVLNALGVAELLLSLFEPTREFESFLLLNLRCRFLNYDGLRLRVVNGAVRSRNRLGSWFRLSNLRNGVPKPYNPSNDGD